MEAAHALNSLVLSYSESDLESMDYVTMPTHTQLASYMSSYHRRQAFGKDSFLPFYFMQVSLLLSVSMYDTYKSQRFMLIQRTVLCMTGRF